MKTLICIPTYNEIENLEPITNAVLEAIPETYKGNVSILVIDDNSPDGTGKRAQELSEANPRLHVLHREAREGLGAAYLAGFKWGKENGFDTFITFDADFSHDPKYLKDMLDGLEDNDLVIGSRYVKGGGTLNWGLFRRVLSRGGSFYSRMILGAPIRDFTGGFTGWRQAVLDSVLEKPLDSQGFCFQIEMKYRTFLKKFRIKEFPIVFPDRKVGSSKVSKRIVLEALWKVWSFRWSNH